MVCLAAMSGAWVAGCFRSGAGSLPPSASLSRVPHYAAPDIVRRELPSRPPTPVTPPVAELNPWKPTVEEREWNYIVLHHTASDAGSVESIHEAHLKRKDSAGNPWLGIGYHFVIGNGNGMGDGDIEPTFRWKQQLHGAHAGAGEYNQHGIGIVLVGNFQETSPSPAQLAAVKRLVGILKADYGVRSENVIGHGDVKATACPGRYFPLAEVTQSSLTPSFTEFPHERSSMELANLQGSRYK